MGWNSGLNYEGFKVARCSFLMGFLLNCVQTGNDLIYYTYYIFFELIFFGEDIKYLIIRQKDPVNLNYWQQHNVAE